MITTKMQQCLQKIFIVLKKVNDYPIILYIATLVQFIFESVCPVIITAHNVVNVY